MSLYVCVDSIDEDKMLATGISRFCEDANLDPTSSTVLILAWKFKAATQCEFTRAEFVGGMTELGYVITNEKMIYSVWWVDFTTSVEA